MFRTLLNKELREQWRTYRLWILGGILLVSAMISPLLAKYTPLLLGSIPGLPPGLAEMIPDPTILDSFSQYIKNASQFGLIVVIVLNMGVMAQEIERGTAAMLLTKPVRRSAVVLAKWSAASLGLIASLMVAGIAFAFYTIVLFGGFNGLDFVALSALLGIFILFYLTLAQMASTLARSQAMGAAIAFGGLLLFLVIDALPGIGKYLPGQLLTWGVSLFSGKTEPAWAALAVTLGLIAVFLVAAAWRFQKEEI